MICFPNAKINIGLNITEKLADGYHAIETVFYPISLCDILEIVEDKEAKEPGIKLIISGLPIEGKAESNLCVKAYQLLRESFSLPPVKVYLHKIIPMGAGLGGGSSDAAFFIKLLNDKFELGLSFGELHHYARQMGSDCSFFINNRPSFASGKGDQLESVLLDLSEYSLVLVYPNIHVSTVEAYSAVVPLKPTVSLEDQIKNIQPEEWKGIIKNDFERSVFEKHPSIENIKNELYAMGATYASMSGSGSAVYGIFRTSPEIPKMLTDFFVWQGVLEVPK